jgi:hypothetical protein
VLEPLLHLVQELLRHVLLGGDDGPGRGEVLDDPPRRVPSWQSTSWTSRARAGSSRSRSWGGPAGTASTGAGPGLAPLSRSHTRMWCSGSFWCRYTSENSGKSGTTSSVPRAAGGRLVHLADLLNAVGELGVGVPPVAVGRRRPIDGAHRHLDRVAVGDQLEHPLLGVPGGDALVVRVGPQLLDGGLGGFCHGGPLSLVGERLGKLPAVKTVGGNARRGGVAPDGGRSATVAPERVNEARTRRSPGGDARTEVLDVLPGLSLPGGHPTRATVAEADCPRGSWPSRRVPACRDAAACRRRSLRRSGRR